MPQSTSVKNCLIKPVFRGPFAGQWRRGQRGEDDPIAQAEQPEPFVVSELIEEVASPSQLEAPDMALGVKAWKANQAHRLSVASVADSSSRDINVLAS